MNKCIIETISVRDYYTVGALDYYWESIIKHLGDVVELISSESKGKRLKRLVYTVEVKDVNKFEEAIKKSVFSNWIFVKNYSAKEKMIQNKIKKLEKENLKLF